MRGTPEATLLSLTVSTVYFISFFARSLRQTVVFNTQLSPFSIPCREKYRKMRTKTIQSSTRGWNSVPPTGLKDRDLVISFVF